MRTISRSLTQNYAGADQVNATQNPDNSWDLIKATQFPKLAKSTPIATLKARKL